MAEYVHLRIKEDTRRLVKAYASIEGLGIDDMVSKLIENYKTKPLNKKNLKRGGK